MAPRPTPIIFVQSPGFANVLNVSKHQVRVSPQEMTHIRRLFGPLTHLTQYGAKQCVDLTHEQLKQVECLQVERGNLVCKNANTLNTGADTVEHLVLLP